MCSLYKATPFWWIYTAKISFFFLPSYNHNLRANIIFQHFASSFLLIQLKVKTINCYAWITSDFVSRWIVHSEGENNLFLRIFLGFVFSAWSAVLLCIPSKWQPAFSKYYCVRWHSWDCAKLVPWAGQYACTLVICLPQIKIMSAGHKHMEPLQEIPFVVLRPILEEGNVISSKKPYSLVSISKCYENYLHFILKTSDFVLLF